MKKLFLSMLAAVTLFASCSQEELVSQADGENLVSFTVTTPELASRLAGDGKTAKNLYYAVYDADGNIVSTISNNNGEAILLETTPTKVSLPLLNGETYSILFWAEADARPEDKMATVNWENKSLSVNPTTSNKETYDAFYAYVKPFVVTGDKTENVKLYRPFAQLNIGTTEKDLIRVAQYYGVTGFTQSQVVVTTPTSMDLTTGNVSGENKFKYAAAKFITPEMLKTDYVYLSMNYLLVSNEKNLVNVEFSCISEGENAKSISKTFENIPVQRNYKTNIYGNLFTSARDWNVEVAPGFDSPEYNPAEQLEAVFEQGGEITLYTDITLNKYLSLGEGKTVTINLNGNTITAPVKEGENSTSYLFYVNGGELNINGEGTIETGEAYYSVPVWVNKGVANIYGGEFKNAGDGCDLIYASGNGVVNIYGGYFKACETKGVEPSTANLHNTLNLQDKSQAKINVYGGTFYKFDPADNKSEIPAISFVADGYSSLAAGDDFVVVKGKKVASAKEFKTALQSTDVVILVDDVELSETFAVNKDITINLNGHNFDASTNISRPFNVENGKLTIVGGNSTIKVGAYGLVNIPEGNDAEIVLEGGIYEGNTDNGSFIKPRGEGKINVTLNNVKYTDSSIDGYVLNIEAYNGNDLIVEVVGGEYVAGGGFNLPDGSSIKNATVKNTNPNQKWNAVEVAGYDTGDVTANVTIENSTIISTGYAVTTGYGAIATVKNCVVNGGTYAYCVYPTGGTINVTGGSYTGDLYVYPFGTNAVADSKIVINSEVKAVQLLN